MPRSLLWPDPRVKPPFGAAEIDRGHPLASFIHGIWLHDEGGGPITDMVTGTRASPQGAPVWIVGPKGLGVSYNGSSGWSLAPESRYDVQYTEKFAIAACVIPNVTRSGGETNHSILCKISNTSPYPGYSSLLCWNNAVATNRTSMRINCANTYPTNWLDAFGSTDLQNNTAYSCLWVYNASNTPTFYVNGVRESITYVGQTLSASILTDVIPQIARRDTGSQFLTGGLVYVYFFRGYAPSASDALELHAEPYAMLRPIVRRRYFVPAGAVTLSLADTATLGLQEAAGVTAGFRLSDVAALGLNEADALLATLTAADAVALGVLDTEALLARLTLADLSAMGLMDAASILGGMTVSDAVALGIIDREMILAQIPLADAAALGLDDVLLLHALLTDLSDALGVGIQESVSVAQAMALALSDTFGLTGIEALTLGVSAVLADTVALNAAETLDLLSTFTMPDGTALTASDALSLLARFSVGDTAALALQDSVTVNALLSLADSCGLGVAEAVTVTAGILLADSCGLTLAEVLDILEALAPALLLFDRPMRLLGGDDRRVALVGGDDRRVALVGP